MFVVVNYAEISDVYWVVDDEYRHFQYHHHHCDPLPVVNHIVYAMMDDFDSVASFVYIWQSGNRTEAFAPCALCHTHPTPTLVTPPFEIIYIYISIFLCIQYMDGIL